MNYDEEGIGGSFHGNMLLFGLLGVCGLMSRNEAIFALVRIRDQHQLYYLKFTIGASGKGIRKR